MAWSAATTEQHGDPASTEPFLENSGSRNGSYVCRDNHGRAKKHVEYSGLESSSKENKILISTALMSVCNCYLENKQKVIWSMSEKHWAPLDFYSSLSGLSLSWYTFLFYLVKLRSVYYVPCLW